MRRLISCFYLMLLASFSNSQIPTDYGNPIYSCVLSSKHDFAIYLLPDWLYYSSHTDSLWYSTSPGTQINITQQFMLQPGMEQYRYDGSFNFYIYDDTTISVNELILISRLDLLYFCVSGDLFANAKDTILSGIPAKYFYYIKTTTFAGITTKTQTKIWHFRYKNRTYSLEFRDVTPTDWTKNKSFYDLYLATMLFLPTSSSTQPLSKDIASKPFLKQFYTLEELLHSDLIDKASSLFIYDLRGRLLMNLDAFKKLNNSSFGYRLSKGFYVSNIKLEDQSTRSIIISNQNK